MSNITKKGLSILLTIVMLFSMMSGLGTVSFADDDNTTIELTLAQEVDNTTPLAGKEFTYTVKYGVSGKQNGQTNVSGLVLTESISDKLEIIDWDNMPDFKSAVKDDDNNITFTFKDNIATSFGGVFKIRVKFKEGVTKIGDTDFGTKATFTFTDSNPSNNKQVEAAAELVTAKIIDSDFALSKNVQPDEPSLGNAVVYKIKVTGESKLGGRNIVGMDVVDTLPSGVTNIKALTEGASIVDNVVTWPSQEIKVGEVKEYLLSCVYPASFSGQIVTNNVNVSGNHYSETDTVERSFDKSHSF